MAIKQSATTEPLTVPDEDDAHAPPRGRRAAWLSRLVGHRELAQCDTYRKMVAELWGTFVLVFVGIGTIVVMEVPDWEHGKSLQIALTFGIGVTVGVWTVAPVSGGHLNPAVSLGFFVMGEMPFLRFVLYVVAQLMGSAMACGTLRLALPEYYFSLVNVNGTFNFGVTMPSTTINYEISVFCAIVVEAVITAILVLTVVSSCDSRRRDTFGLTALMVGFSVVVCHCFAIRVTGSSMNPARSFGPALFTGNWAKHYVYWVGPMAGGAAAALLYKWVLSCKWERCADKKHAPDWELAELASSQRAREPSPGPFGAAAADSAPERLAAETSAHNGGTSARDPQLVSLIP